MHHYPHHIGDFNAGTVRLTQLERWLYRDMIEVYYDTEGPLPADIVAVCKKVGARGDEQKAIVAELLADKFVRTADGFRHERCDDEIAIYRAKAETAKQNGSKGGRPRKAPAIPPAPELPTEPEDNPEKPSGFSVGSSQDAIGKQSETGSKTNQEPGTTNHSSVLRTDASAPSNLTDEQKGEPEPSEKAQLWAKVKAMLMADGLTKAQAGTFVGGLVKDHGESVAREAMRIAVAGDPPADARSYLTATCQHVAGERASKVPGWWTSDDLAKKQAALVGVGGPRAGESTDVWHARIRAAIENGGKPPAPPTAFAPRPAEPESPKVEATIEQIAERRAALRAALKPAAVVDGPPTAPGVSVPATTGAAHADLNAAR
jgi:uncharacterized protein YdaU (DUF1376 family)